jgi:hypothetical protein
MTEWKQQLINMYCNQDSALLFTQYIKYPQTEKNEISVDELYQDYEVFCSREQIKMISKKIFTEQLTNCKFILALKRVTRQVNKKKTNYYIAIINEENTYKDDDNSEQMSI